MQGDNQWNSHYRRGRPLGGWFVFWRQLIYGPVAAITQLDDDNEDDDLTPEMDLWEKFICCSWLSSLAEVKNVL